MKKQLVFLADSSSIHTFRWVEALIRYSNFTPTIISLNPAPNHTYFQKYPEIKIYRLGNASINPAGGNWRYLLHYFSLKKIINSIKPDIICSIYLSSYGFLSSLLSKKHLLCHIAIGTDIMQFPKKSILHKLITYFSIRRSDLLVSVSQTATQEIRQIFNHNKIITQQYGINHEINAFETPVKDIAILSNRQWVPNSNINYILELLKRKNAINQSSWVIGAPQEEIPTLEKSHNANIIFSPALPPEENFKLVGRSIFFISIPTSDGASLSLLEAMYLGAIPIVSNIPPNREWITDGVNGFLLDLKDVNYDTNKLNDILNTSDDILERMRSINKALVKEKALSKTNTQRFEAEINNLLNN